jgi:hypothetical protein
MPATSALTPTSTPATQSTLAAAVTPIASLPTGSSPLQPSQQRPEGQKIVESSAKIEGDAASISASGSVPTAVSRPNESTLAAAIAAGKITARFSGTGGSSGDAMRVTIQKTAAAGPGTLTFSIPPGTLLRSSNASEQNMVIAGVRGRQVDAQRFTPQSQIVVTDAAPATYVLEAYCAEFHKGNPAASTAFTMTTADPVLSRILAEGKKRSLSTQAIQAAVWIATDKVTYEQMKGRFPHFPRRLASGEGRGRLLQPGRSGNTAVNNGDRKGRKSACQVWHHEAIGSTALFIEYGILAS